jgi:hypothetical protein
MNNGVDNKYVFDDTKDPRNVIVPLIEKMPNALLIAHLCDLNDHGKTKLPQSSSHDQKVALYEDHNILDSALVSNDLKELGNHQYIAQIISFMKPKIAGKILSHFEIKERQDILSALGPKQSAKIERASMSLKEKALQAVKKLVSGKIFKNNTSIPKISKRSEVGGAHIDI